jgi:curved DNA-binding protein CbpA
MRARNYYDILGIDPNATQEETRSAYYIRARVLHPDRFDPYSQKREWQKANEMLAELNEAYAVLRDATKRLEYDREMGYAGTPPPAASTSKAEARSEEAHGSQSSQKEKDSRHASRKDAQPQESPAPKTGPTHLTFGALSSDSREKLLDRRRGKGRHLAWRTKNLWVELACIIAALSSSGVTQNRPYVVTSKPANKK